MRIVLKRVSPAPSSCYAGKSLPDRMCWLHPDAEASFQRLSARVGGAVLSDMYRDATGSLLAHNNRRGAQRPGWSTHGYGLAFDLDVDATLARWRAFAGLPELSYADLLPVFAAEGWYCHRRDEATGPECWHFNFLDKYAAECLQRTNARDHSTWASAGEHLIVERYPALLAPMPDDEIQSALLSLGFDVGPLDGILGPRSQRACAAFGAAWGVPAHGLAFKRTLRFVAASIERS